MQCRRMLKKLKILSRSTLDVNITADDKVIQGAKASAAMALSKLFCWSTPASVPESSIHWPLEDSNEILGK